MTLVHMSALHTVALLRMPSTRLAPRFTIRPQVQRPTTAIPNPGYPAQAVGPSQNKKTLLYYTSSLPGKEIHREITPCKLKNILRFIPPNWTHPTLWANSSSDYVKIKNTIYPPPGGTSSPTLQWVSEGSRFDCGLKYKGGVGLWVGRHHQAQGALARIHVWSPDVWTSVFRGAFRLVARARPHHDPVEDCEHAIDGRSDPRPGHVAGFAPRHHLIAILAIIPQRHGRVLMRTRAA